MTFVLAIDPGSSKARVSHTGIVLLDDNVRLVDSWAVPWGVNGFRRWADDNLGCELPGTPWINDKVSSEDYTVVCEAFTARVTGVDCTPLLVEGAVRFLWPDAVMQDPSGYKTAIPDEMLMHFGLWSFGGKGGKDHHADRRAAARHALWYLLKHGHPAVWAAARELPSSS